MTKLFLDTKLKLLITHYVHIPLILNHAKNKLYICTTNHLLHRTKQELPCSNTM